MGTLEESNNSGACEFAGETTFARETMCFYKYGGSWGRESGVCVSSFWASIWESCWQKMHETFARARFALQNVKNEGSWDSAGFVRKLFLLRHGVGLMVLCGRDCKCLWQNALARMRAGKQRHCCCSHPAFWYSSWKVWNALSRLRERYLMSIVLLLC